MAVSMIRQESALAELRDSAANQDRRKKFVSKPKEAAKKRLQVLSKFVKGGGAKTLGQPTQSLLNLKDQIQKNIGPPDPTKHFRQRTPLSDFGDGDGSWWDRWLGMDPPEKRLVLSLSTTNTNCKRNSPTPKLTDNPRSYFSSGSVKPRFGYVADRRRKERARRERINELTKEIKDKEKESKRGRWRSVKSTLEWIVWISRHCDLYYV